jgi:hypothetical protein
MIPFNLQGSLPGHILFTKRWIDRGMISFIFRMNRLKSFNQKASKPLRKFIFYNIPLSRTFFSSFCIPPFLKVPGNPILFNTPHYWNSFLLVKSFSAFPGFFLPRFLFLIPYVLYGLYLGKWPAVTNDSFI